MSTWTVVLIVIVVGLVFIVLLLLAAATALLFGRRAVQARIAKYLKPNPSDIERDLVRLKKKFPSMEVDEVAAKYVSEQAVLLGVVGFMTEMFGFALPVVGFAIDAGFTTIRQMRMVHVIAALYGDNDLLDPEDMEIHYMALVGVGTLLPRFVLKFLAGEIPVIGGIANFGINWFVTTSIGRTAIGWNTGKSAREIVSGELKRLKSTALNAKESATGVVKPYLRRDPVPQNLIDGNQPVLRSIEAGSEPALVTDRQYLNQPTVAAQVRFCPTCGKQAQPTDMFCFQDGTPLPRQPISLGSIAQDSNIDIKGTEKMLRYDGLYVTKLPVDYGITSYSYLRFYVDGTVIESSIQGDRSAEAMRWFDKGDRSISSGSYNTNGNEIQFSIRSDSGVVDYSGRIIGDELRLHSYSHINGFETDDEWAFVAAP